MPTLHGNNASDAALVAIDPATGDILALVGSADYGDSAIQGQVDLATAERQPGATIAPFVYLAALEHHQATLATTLHDAPTQYSMGAGQPPYEPKDDDGNFRGPVTARRALATSLTVPTVELLNQIGVEPLLTLLRQLGIGTLGEPASHYGLSLALGGEPVRLLDLTYAYAALANGGVQAGEPVPNPAPGDSRLAPVAILKVTDATGQVLSDRGTPAGVPVASAPVAWLVTNVLADDASRAERLGAHSTLELPDRPAAARAATSTSLKDAWAFGYTPRLAVGVWVGNADGAPMKQAFGLEGPGKLWHDFVEAALAGQPAVDFARPPGLVRVRGEWFILGTQPAVTIALPTVPVQAAAPATGPAAPAPPAAAKPGPPKNPGRGRR